MTSGEASMVRIMTVQQEVEALEQTMGRHLRARRIDAGLSRSELAARANVSVGALKTLEGGTGSSVTTLVKVLRGLGAQDWLDQLAPPAKRFNPLDLLAERERQARRRTGPPRVRRAGRASGAG
jgi:transcriptional regulator with XRE-family HTH domain